MAKFRYIITNFASGEIRDVAPFSAFTYNDVLNAAGGWSASLPYDHQKATPDNLSEGNTGVYVERGGQILFGGLLWTVNGGSGKDLQVGGEGSISYYGTGRNGARRTIRSRQGMTYADTTNDIASQEITWTGVDQFRVVKDVFDHAANIGGDGDPGFTGIRFHGPGGAVSEGTLSGVTMSRTIFGYERRSPLVFVQETAKLLDGFDFRVSCDFDASSPPQPRRYLDLWYPRIGGRAAAIFIQNKNATLESYTGDASGLANVWTEAGAGLGDARIIQEQSDSALIYPSGTFPYMEGTRSQSDGSNANLLSLSRSGLAANKRPIKTFTMTVEDTVDSPLGGYIPGDSAYVSMNDGYYQMNEEYRIISVGININDAGTARAKVGLASLDASLGEG